MDVIAPYITRPGRTCNGVGRSTNYVFGGQIVAQRNTSTGVVTMLIGDHLGSVSATTNLSGVRQSVQYFDPWGRVRTGTVQASTFNYTGQRRDDTGLLYYNARYYDPARGQFISADSIVPGSPSGGTDGIGLAALTTDLSDPMFAAQIVAEQSGALDDKIDRSGPANVAALNRYSYVQNNPMQWTDPSGHGRHCDAVGCGGEVKNRSSVPVVVFGDRRKESCAATDVSDGCYESVGVTLQPGESSTDYGFVDVDVVLAADGYTLDGYNSDYMFKLATTGVVTVVDSPTGARIYYGTKGGDAGHLMAYAYLETGQSGWRHRSYDGLFFQGPVAWIDQYYSGGTGRMQPQPRSKCRWRNVAVAGALGGASSAVVNCV